MTSVAVVGCGYWGPKLARNLADLTPSHLYAVCDLDGDKARQVAEEYGARRHTSDLGQLLADPEVGALVIATPAETHFELARRALEAGKHVLVEKPLALRGRDCGELIHLAAQDGLVLMVGHTFLYNAAVRTLKELIEGGEIGDVYYAYCSRLGLGIIREDINAMWNFAPHDVSILLYVLGAVPRSVQARGFTYLQEGVADVVFMGLEFPGNVAANIHVSWLDPKKTREITVVGSKKMVVYDDTSMDSKIKVFDMGVDRIPRPNVSEPSMESFGEFQLQVRVGDLHCPQIDFVEPLSAECRHFVDCIVQGVPPLTDGLHGQEVVRILEAAEASIAGGGARVDIDWSS